MENYKTSFSLGLGWELQAGVSSVSSLELREGLLEFIPCRRLGRLSWGAQGTEGSSFTRMNSAVEIPIMMSGFNI